MRNAAHRSPLPYIEKLATVVASRWRARHHDAEAFSDIASQALRDFPSSEYLSPPQLLDWASNTPRLPHQDGPANRFGEPAVRLYDDGRFFIQALFWYESTTSIHQHSFSGAFQVLCGSSLHSAYRFNSTHRFSEHLQSGELTLNAVELLSVGDVRSIRNGSRFIHSLFHLDYPSVSFLVRTHNDVEAGPLYSYLRPGLAYNSFHVTPRLRMLRECVVAAYKMSRIHGDRLVARVVRSADVEELFHLTLVLRDLHPVVDWPSLPKPFDRVLNALPAELHTLIRHVLLEYDRTERIVGARRSIHDAELRYFLALLANISDRETLFSLVRRRYPGKQAIPQIVDWTRRLWDTPSQINGEGNALGLECAQEVKRPALKILRALWEGEPVENIARRLPSYGGVSEVCQLWQQQPMFQRLLA